jgi:uracil-DNA glycosylase family 4
LTLAPAPLPAAVPARDCPLCPRLAGFRTANRAAFPGWFHAPVPGFGPHGAPLLIVGLAPGLRGANRTGRPFTGDFAGTLLYETLLRHGLANGTYGAAADDGLTLTGARIVNAVRCVPPQNKPLPAEIATCAPFLATELAAMPNLRAILALGAIAHAAVLRAHGLVPARHPFAHGQMVALPGGVRLAASYHVSRYNQNTRRLTPPMFDALVGGLVPLLGG